MARAQSHCHMPQSVKHGKKCQITKSLLRYFVLFIYLYVLLLALPYRFCLLVCAVNAVAFFLLNKGFFPYIDE